MSRPAPTPRSLLVPALAAFGVAMAMAVLARGTAGDEEVGHFLIAKWAPVHPELFLSLVGRPLATLALAIPSQLGLVGARAAAALATGLTALAVMRVVARTGWLPAGWGGALLVAQPFFLAHAATAMTEPWTALVVAGGLLAVVERRPRLLVAAMALAPLARLELVLLWPAAGAWLLRERLSPRGWAVTAAVLIGPLVAWSVLGGLPSGDPLWLLHQADWGAYPEREPAHYLKCLGWVIGPGLILPVALGLAGLARRPARGDAEPPEARTALRAAALVLAALLAVYTIFAWLRPVTFGNLRYLVAAAPALAILAAAGAARLARPLDRGGWMAVGAALVVVALAWSHRLFDDFTILPAFWPVPLAAALLLVAIGRFAAGRPATVAVAAVAINVLFLGIEYRTTLHLAERPEEAAAHRLARAARSSDLAPAPLFAAHPVINWRLGRDPWDRRTAPALTAAALESAPRGALLAWESHYVPGLTAGLDPARLVRNGGWTKRAEATAADTSWAGALFEKTGKGGPDRDGDAGLSSASDQALLGMGGGAEPGDDPWFTVARSAQLRLTTARRAAAAAPNDAARWRDYARGLLAASRDAEGLNAFVQAAKLDPDNPANDVFRAEVLQRSGDQEKALAAIQRALAADDANGEAHLLAARILEALGRTAESRAHEHQAADRLPDRWDVQYRSGRRHAALNEWEPAGKRFRRVVDLKPTHPDAAIYLAGAELQQGHLDGAAAVLRAFVRRVPTEPRGWLALGDVLAEQHRPEEAVATWKAGIAATGGSPILEQRLRNAGGPGSKGPPGR